MKEQTLAPNSPEPKVASLSPEDKNIILCGFMGCGKSSIGRRLSKITGRRFVDMDTYIEKKAGKSIRQIFSDEGEEAFRKMEETAALVLSREKGLVIASGGGTVLREKSRKALAETGIILLLDVPFPALRERLKNDTVRPLLQRPDRDQAMEALFSERMPKYKAAADMVIPAGAPCNVVAREIARCLGLLPVI